MRFKKDISSIGLLFASLSCMIGSGWLFGAFFAAKIAGPAALLCWPIAGGMIIILALCFAELATILPVAGGLARYSHYTHGELTSFCVGWLAWLSCVAVAPTEVQAILQYSAQYYPWLILPSTNDIIILSHAGIGIAAILLAVFSAINIMGIKTLAKYNNLIAIWKVTIPIFVCAILIYQSYHVNIQHINLTNNFMPYGIKSVLLALPAAGILFSFLGFREATSLAGETRNPSKSLPIAVIGSVVICTIIYTIIQFAFLYALPTSAIAQGWHQLSYQHASGPFSGLALSLGIYWLSSLVYLDSIITPSGTGLVYTATTARLNYAMAINKYIPHNMLKLNQHGVPFIAIIINFIIGLILFFPLPGWQALIKFQSLAIVIAYSTGPITLLILRNKIPEIKRPFALSAPYPTALVAFYVCSLLIYWSGWDSLWRILVGLGIGCLIFSLYQMYSHNISIVTNSFKACLWLFLYLGLLSLVTFWGPFNQEQPLIGFGVDFVLLAIISIIMLHIAVTNSKSRKYILTKLHQDQELKDDDITKQLPED